MFIKNEKIRLNQGIFMKILSCFIICLSILFCNNSTRKERSPAFDANPKPRFYLGLYVSNQTARNPKDMERLLEQSQTHGINTWVIDVQPRPLPKDILTRLKTYGIYGVARVVVFEQGLTTEFPSKEHRNQLVESIRSACRLGFREINLDYIRYSDGGWKFKASFKKRYENIQSIILDLREGSSDACSSEVQWSADVFGRVPFLENDPIGQRIEEFSEVVDLIYPMLYPSHFYGLQNRQADPYSTVKEGLERTMQRSKSGTEVVAWIQGFEYFIKVSGLNFQDYIRFQMQAALDSGCKGFVVWNARNDYFHTWKALQEFRNENEL